MTDYDGPFPNGEGPANIWGGTWRALDTSDKSPHYALDAWGWPERNVTTRTTLTYHWLTTHTDSFWSQRL